ncbi:MAG: SAM-dependent methyltransferase [Candidatus Binataceae bacterium]
MATYEPRDKYYRKARARGLPSRAAFKIEELIARSKLVPRGGRIADLGCAPGGWLAILARTAGSEGRVVGVDLARCSSVPAGVVTIVGDIVDAATVARVLDALGGAADLVTSDLAPKLTGIASRDEARSRSVLSAALGFARRALKPGGAMIAKVFMGAEFKQAVAEFEGDFGSVEVTRTAATRPGSAELYIVARDFRGQGG